MKIGSNNPALSFIAVVFENVKNATITEHARSTNVIIFNTFFDMIYLFMCFIIRSTKLIDASSILRTIASTLVRR